MGQGGRTTGVSVRRKSFLTGMTGTGRGRLSALLPVPRTPPAGPTAPSVRPPAFSAAESAVRWVVPLSYYCRSVVVTGANQTVLLLLINPCR